ncbi:MAG: hypothetical protein E6I08_15630 [Chloroflexi bacterium]|nr:MAG: hypothetical protein E6I08_15630 [Chloroflexota bacterium]
MRGTPITTALLLLAVVLVVVAFLYALGTIGWFANPNDVHHYKHAAAFFVLAVLAAVGANFARDRPAAG